MRLSAYVLATRLDQVVAAANERLGHMRDQRYILCLTSIFLCYEFNGWINCYTMIPWKLSFQYYDEGFAKDNVLNATPESVEYNAFWSAMLKDFTKHLKEKEWFAITSISMDERNMKDMQAVIKLVKEIDPAWKISLAGDYHSRN